MFGFKGFGTSSVRNPWLRPAATSTVTAKPAPASVPAKRPPAEPPPVLEPPKRPKPEPKPEPALTTVKPEPSSTSLPERLVSTTLREILGQDKAVAKVRTLLEVENQSAVLLHGPSGSGKSAFVRAYAADAGLALLDVTPELLTIADYSFEKADDEEGKVKRGEAATRVLRSALAGAVLFGPERLVVIDDADAMPASVWRALDRALPSMMPGRKLIVVANDLYGDKAMAELRGKFGKRTVRFYSLAPGLVERALRGAATKFGLKVADVRRLADASGGDLRRAYKLLEFAALSEAGEATLPEPGGERLTSFDLFEAAGHAFDVDEAIGLLSHDVRLMVAFAGENAAQLVKHVDAADRAAAALSLVDLFFRFGAPLGAGPEIAAAVVLPAVREIPPGSFSKAAFPSRLLRTTERGEARPLSGATRRSNPASRALARCR